MLRSFFSVNFYCSFSEVFVCFYTNNLFMFIFRLKYESLSQNMVRILQCTYFAHDSWYLKICQKCLGVWT